MPLVADLPRVNVEQQLEGYRQSTVLGGLSGSAWERSLAQSLAYIRQANRSLLAGDDVVYAVLLSEVEMLSPPLVDTSSSRT
jgi:hypothetical protein